MTEVETLEPGTYRVQLQDLKETILENPQFGNGDVIRFVLHTTEVTGTDGQPVEIDGIANDKLTPLSKLTRWLGAFGVSAEPGEELDMEQAIGLEAMAVIVNRPSKDGSGNFARVDDLVPLPKTGTRRVVAASGDDELSAWWKQTRDEKFERKHVLEFCEELFGAEPSNITAAERAELLERLRGAA